MHGQYRDIAAVLLLVTFVAGGLLGPSLHRVHHTLEEAAEESCHSAAVHHADSLVLTDEDTSVAARNCALCVTRLLVVLPTIETLTAPTVLGTPPLIEGAHLVPVHVFTDRTIRGPPRLS